MTPNARTSDPRTSDLAAESITTRKRTDLKAEILAQFRRRPVKGWTDFELEEVVCAKTGLTPNRVRTARSELTCDPLWGTGREPILVTNALRQNIRGRWCQVYRLAVTP